MGEITGEYWISDGWVDFADGDVGDKNHEMIAINHFASKYVDELIDLAHDLEVDLENDNIYKTSSGRGFLRNEEYPAGDCEAIRNKIISSIENKEIDWNLPEGVLVEDSVDEYIQKTLKIDDEEFSCIFGNCDARQIIMKREGWIAVRNNNIELYGYNDQKRKEIINGIESILDQEGIEEADEEIELYIYDYKTGRSWDLPLSDPKTPVGAKTTTIPNTTYNKPIFIPTSNSLPPGSSSPRYLDAKARSMLSTSEGFKNWLNLNEMAFVSKQPIYIDKYDLAYLKQFPLFFWPRALKLRYNDYLIEALRTQPKENIGSISKNWSDVKDVNFVGDQRTRNPINFSARIIVGMPRLINKLIKLGYDLSGINSNTGESLYFNLMSPQLATQLTTKLKHTISSGNLRKYKNAVSSYRIQGRQIPKKLMSLLDPKPNIVYFVPNYRSSNRHDPEPGKVDDIPYEVSWDNMRPQIDEIIAYFVKNLVQRGRNKVNATYWSQGAKDSNGRTITQQLYDHIRNNWKQIKHDKKSIYLAVFNKVNTILQGGVLPRRIDDMLKSAGINMFDVMQRMNWTPEQVRSLINKHRTHGGDIVDLVDEINFLTKGK